MSLAACAPIAHGDNVLLITAGSTPTSQESLRQATFTGWGHTVTTLAASSTQTQYDTALAAADVAWVTEEVFSTNVAYKLRETSVGVVCGEPFLDNELGISTSDGYEESSTNQILVTSNSHSVSSELSTGFITIFSSTQPRNLSNPTAASGLTVLATGSSGDPALAVLEAGAALANTYNGNSTASGRRVRLPWGGNSFDWSSLDADGLSIARNALEWAAAGSDPEPDEPILWYKFDDTSGQELNYGTIGAPGNASYSGSVARGEASLISDGGRSTHFAGGRISPGSVSGVNSNPGSPWSQRTYEFWFRADHTNGRQVLFKQGATTRNLTVYLEDDVLYFVASNRANDDGSGGAAPWGNPAVAISTTGLAAGRTYHVAAVLDANTTDLSGVIRGYLNGELFDSTTNVGPVWNMASLIVGRASSNRYHDNTTSSQTFPFSGRIDEFKLWDGVLSDETIRDIYRDGWGLMGHWRLDETSGVTAVDDSGSGRDGTHSGSATLGVEAVRRRGVEFNTSGSNDRIDLPHTAIDGLDAVSVSWWMRTSNTGQTTVLSGARGSQNNAFLLYFESATRFRPFVDGSSRSYTIDSIATGDWRHYVYQLDREAGLERLYVNGQLVLDGTISPTTAEIDIDPGGLMLAQEQDSVGGGFDSNQLLSGGLDDVRIYGRVISEREIGELYGLTGHWRLDETTGDIAADESLLAEAASYEEATTLAAVGARGTAVTLNSSGTDDYVDLPHLALDNAESWSFAWWMRTEDEETQTVLSGARASNSNVLTIDTPAPEELRLTLNNTQRSWTIPPINDGTWRQFVVMHDGETGDSWLYVNGQLVGTYTHPVAQPLMLDHGGLVIGQEQDNVGGQFDRGVVLLGDLDDVQIYNRLMTGAEIAEHYGLVGWWRMEETSGTDVADSSGAGNHGTIAGSATWSTDAKEGDGSLSLDGADYVEVPSSLVDGEDGVTLAGWARLTDTGSSGAVLIDIGNLFGITIDHANTARGTNTYGYTGSGFEFLSTATYYEDTGWRHYATVFDADTEQTSLYVDGVLKASMSLAGPVAFQYAVDRTKLGDYGSGSSWRLTGELDDMRVYNRALTADEIQALSGSTSTGVRIVRWVEVANP